MGFWPEDSCRSENSQKLGMVLFDIISPIEGHSKKPDEAREKIVALMGDVPRVELFARQETPGWDVWGNEIDSDVIIQGYPVPKYSAKALREEE